MRSQCVGGNESHVARSCFNCIVVNIGDHSSLCSHLSDDKKAGEKVFRAQSRNILMIYIFSQHVDKNSSQTQLRSRSTDGKLRVQ